MRKLILFILVFILTNVLPGRGHCQTQTVKLTQLEKGQTGGTPVKGLVGITRASDGKQRYGVYVNIADVCRPTTPLPTGNTTNLSEFVVKCSTDSIWYIDWEGRSLFLGTQAGGSAVADKDWLEIGNNQVPDNIRDSIYTDNYAAINVRRVWPSAQLLVGDSVTAGNVVVLGNRNTRVGFYRLTGPDWSSIGQEGASLTARLGTGTGGFEITEVGGTGPTQSTGPERQIFRVNTDSTIQLYDYPRTRNDTNGIVNFLYTDEIGVLRSSPVTEFPGGGGGMDSIVTTIRLTGKGTDVDPLDISAPIFENSHVVEFKRPTVYGSEFEPVTWPNITLNNTDAVLQTQLMIHNNASTAPTFPNTCAVSGTYKLGFNNYIRFTRVSPIFFVVNINE